MELDLLDRPVWNSLRTGWAHLAEGDARAWRLDRGHGLFGASADGSEASMTALAALVPKDGQLWVVDGQPWPPPPGTRLAMPHEAVVQMVLEAPVSGKAPGFEVL